MSETQELVLRTPTALEIERERFLPVMDVQAALEHRKTIIMAYQELMVEGQDFGKIPGGDKPTLLQPGAQKLDSLFGLVPRYTILERTEDWTGADHGGEPFFRYLIMCQVWRGDFIRGEALGECNSWESKYRYRTADRVCPDCGQATIFRSKKDDDRGWFCWAKKGGCGAKFKADDERITKQETGRKVNDAIFDQVNTILKMAEIRAHRAATINATSASELFTQDMEELAERSPSEPPVEEGVRPRAQASPAPPKAPARDTRFNGMMERIANNEKLDHVYGEILDALEGRTSKAFADDIWKSALRKHGDPDKKPGAVGPVMEDLLNALREAEERTK